MSAPVGLELFRADFACQLTLEQVLAQVVQAFVLVDEE
jgi:hypothetical protein